MERGKVIVTGKVLVATAVTIDRLGSHTGTGKEWADRLIAVTAAVVVHHSFCGTSSIPENAFKKFHERYHADISTLFDLNSVAIPDFEKRLKYDLELLRSGPAVPKHFKLYGFFDEINSGKLIEVARDVPALAAA